MIEQAMQRLKAFAILAMATLRPEITGLDVTLWVSSRAKSRHGPRVKVAKKFGNNLNFSITISNTPEVTSHTEKFVDKLVDGKTLQRIKRWIILNRELLLQFWNSEITEQELRAHIRKLPK